MMYYIKTCPSCGSKIRFPLNKGKIRVNCQCGHSFIADPDDKSLYKNGSFDLSENPGKAKSSNSFFNRLASLKKTPVKESIIKNLYDAKYTMQNFKLLPTDVQKKIILKIIIISVLLAALIILLSIFITPRVTPDMI